MSKLLFTIIERIFDWSQHQGQWRAKLMTDIAEEGGLGPVQFGQCLRALALLFIGTSIGNGAGNLCLHQIEEVTIVVVERQSCAYAGDHQSGEFMRFT